MTAQWSKGCSQVTDLNSEVDNAEAGQLLIIPATTVGNPYRLAKPLKLKQGVGVLPDRSGVEGFFEIAPASSFTIGEDPVFCLMLLGENSYVIGLKSDARNAFEGGTFDANNELRFNQQDEKIRALVYATGISGFKLSWADLTGRFGMDSVVLANNAADRSNVAGGTFHKVEHSWIETSGATHAVKIETAEVSDPDKKENVEVAHNVLLVNGMSDETTKERAIHAKNGCGEIEHNDIRFDDRVHRLSKVRVGVALEAVDGTVVKENAFFSAQPEARDNDFIFELLNGDNAMLRAELSFNARTDRANLWTGNVDGSGVKRDDIYRQISLPYFQTKEEFFRRGARAGISLTPLYLVRDLDATQIHITGTDVSAYAAGEKDELEFDFPYDDSSHQDNSGLKAAAGLGWAVSGIEFVALTAVGYFAWKFSRRAGKVLSKGAAGRFVQKTAGIVNDVVTGGEVPHQRLEEEQFNEAPVPDTGDNAVLDVNDYGSD